MDYNEDRKTERGGGGGGGGGVVWGRGCGWVGLKGACLTIYMRRSRMSHT
jgi:hypothetical protein